MLKNITDSLKDTIREISFPRGLDLVLIMLFISVYAVFNAFMICGDCFFGYAITESIRHPLWYSASDLVTSGSGNFLFYKAMAYFPFFNDNFNLRDFVITTPLTLLLILAWYNIFKELLHDRKLILLAVFFLLFSDTKLYLHGYPIPFFILTSLGSIHFISIFSFFFFLRKRYVASFVLLALASYFHPASALVFLFMFGIAMVIENRKSVNIKTLATPFLAAFLLMVPNFFFLNPGLSATQQDVALLFDISYKIKQFASIYISDYLDKTYFYTFSALALALFVYKKKKFNINHERLIIRLIIIGFVGSGLWLVNFYFIHNITIFYILFVARAFYLIKPLFIVYIISVFNDLVSRKNWLVRIGALLLAISLITFSSFVGGLILLAAIGFYVLEPKYRCLSEREGLIVGKREKLFIAATFLIIIVLFGYMRNNKFLKIFQLLRGQNTFNFSFDASKNYSVSKTNPEFSVLMDWAKRYQGKLFLVPLDGRNDFVYFRYLTKNSIYANIDDMGQLTYSPPNFLEGYRRMTKLGFKIIKAGELDFSGYNRLSFAELEATGADFAIFDKKSAGYGIRQETPIFETNRYVVFELNK